MSYQTIVGLEVHVQLATKTKLFCGCPTTFGAEPNTQVCPVCLGLPGSLPIINAEAVRLALETGVALNCVTPSAEADNVTKWDRKQYFYPDLPKGYQTSQFDLPITETGWLEVPPRKTAARRSGSASPAPTSRKTPARACTTSRAPVATRSSTSTAPARRCWRLSASPTSARPRRRRRTSTS